MKISEDIRAKTITTCEAAKLIRKSAEFIRAGLRDNRFPFRNCSTS